MTTTKYIKQLSGETVIYGLSSTMTKVINFFLIPLYTRVFTPSEYGIVAIIASFQGLIGTFVVLGMDNASARWFYNEPSTNIEERKRIISTWFWLQVVVSILATLLIVIFSGPLALKLTDSSELRQLIIITGLTFPLSTFKRVLNSWLRFQRRAWNTITFSMISSLITIGLTILFVLVLKLGLSGIYWAELIALIVMAFIAAFILKDWIAPKYFSFSLLKNMSIFALPLVPAAIAGWVTASADRFILKGYVETNDIGLYSIAASLASVLSIAVGAFQMAWGPFAYSILEDPGAKKVYSKVFSLYCWLGALGATALSIFAPLILKILTTSNYAGASSSVSFLAFSILAIGATYIASLACGIVKKSVPLSISIFLGAVVNTILNFILIPYFGKNGAAIATLVAYTTATIYLFVVGQKLYSIPYRFMDAFICFLVSWCIIGIDYFFLPPWGAWSFVARIGFCFLFLPLGLLLRIIHVDTLSSLISSAFKSIGKRIPR